MNMAYFLRSMREYRRVTIVTPIFVVCEVFFAVLLPYYMARLIDIGIMKGDLSYIYKMGGLLLLMAIGSLFFGVLSAYCGSLAGAGLAKNLRQDIFYHIQQFSFRNIDHFSPAGLVTRLTTDISNVQMAFIMCLRLLARAPIMIILSIIMTFTVNLKIALLFMIFVPVLGGGLIMIASKAHPHFVKVYQQYDVLNNVVQENIQGARVVKAYVRREEELEKFTNVSCEVYRLFNKAEKIIALYSPLMQFTIYMVVLGMIYFGGRSIVTGQLAIGQLTALLVYALQIMIALMLVSFVFIMITISEASRGRIIEVLSEVPEMDENGAITAVHDGSIIFENVSFSYADDGQRMALKDINLNIKSGQMIGIIGGTGSAKSTLVQLIPRLYDVTGGSIRVGGVDVRNYNIHALRDAVAMVLQKNLLFTGTIAENIRWGDEQASDKEVEAVAKIAQADTFIREFSQGYETVITQGGNNVSGGQKQRLCIARALLKKPKILILDDSTSAVDMKTEAKIRQQLRETLPDTTKIIIAQRIASIEDADQIIVMDDGAVVGVGTSEELLKTNSIYREVYESQQGSVGHE